MGVGGSVVISGGGNPRCRSRVGGICPLGNLNVNGCSKGDLQSTVLRCMQVLLDIISLPDPLYMNHFYGN